MRALDIQPTKSLRNAMELLDATAEKCLFVVDDSGVVIGSLTDGDIRRAILKGAPLSEPVTDHYNKSPTVVSDGPNANKVALEHMASRRIQVVPIVDDSGCVVRYVTLNDTFQSPDERPSPKIDCPLVVMAGGFGTRLAPFTSVLPKALIPVHEKPIIEHIIDRFVEQGVQDVWLTVNYKSRIIKAYFDDRQPEYSVHFVDEPNPLGTAGSLKFLTGTIRGNFFVTNCDIVVDTNYEDVLRFHSDNDYAITLVGSTMHYQIPYGTCILTSSGSLARIDEKPSYDFIVNTGMYVINSTCLELIPSNEAYHMTDLIGAVLESGREIGVFPVSEASWIDVGQWQEFRKAAERL